MSRKLPVTACHQCWN